MDFVDHNSRLQGTYQGRPTTHPFIVDADPGHRWLADAAAAMLDNGRMDPWAEGVTEEREPEMYALRHAVGHSLEQLLKMFFLIQKGLGLKQMGF